MNLRKLILPLAALCMSLTLRSENEGHRLGGDVFPPENTLKCYKKALERLQAKPSFDYAECDLQETKDGKIVVFHDTDGIGRMVPDTRHNRGVLAAPLKAKPFATVTLQDLTLDQVQSLELADGAQIPTLAEVLKKSVDWKLKKPLLLEIKLFLTDACRTELLKAVAAYKKNLDVNFMATPKNFEVSFPELDKWRPLFTAHGFKVYTDVKPKTDKYDLLNQGGGKDATASPHANELTVVTYTGKEKNSGTNKLDIYVAINGDEKFKLDNRGVNDFEPGAVDVFKGLKFKCKPDEIEKFTLMVEGGKDAWELTQVEFAVKVDGVALTPVVFKRKVWLSTEKTDRKARDKKDFFLKGKLRLPEGIVAK